MPPSQSSSAASVQWPSWLLATWRLARPICCESQAARDVREAEDARRAELLQAKAADTRVLGVWAYKVGDCEGCYLIGKHGSTTFYYEDGVLCRLFGVLQEERPGSGTYLVILNIGTLRIRPSSGSMISEFKPWDAAELHDAVIASKVIHHPAGGASPDSAGQRRRGSSMSPIDFAFAAEAVMEDTNDTSEMFGRLGTIGASSPSFATESEFGGASYAGASFAGASFSAASFQSDVGSDGAGPGYPRAVDVSGKWELFEQTGGKFIFLLKQDSTGAVRGRGRSCDDAASDWSIAVRGRLEGRMLSWTEYISREEGQKPTMRAGEMVAVISPCAQFFGGVGSSDGQDGKVPQHFAGMLVRRSRDKPAAPAAVPAG